MSQALSYAWLDPILVGCRPFEWSSSSWQEHKEGSRSPQPVSFRLQASNAHLNLVTVMGLPAPMIATNAQSAALHPHHTQYLHSHARMHSGTQCTRTCTCTKDPKHTGMQCPFRRPRFSPMTTSFPVCCIHYFGSKSQTL